MSTFWAEEYRVMGMQAARLERERNALAEQLAQKDAQIKALQEELDNVRPFEALHADLSKQLREAWDATGVAGTVEGMTTLADVVRVTKSDLQEALGMIKALADVLEEVRERKSAVAVWIEDGKEVSLLAQIDAALRLVERL